MNARAAPARPASAVASRKPAAAAYHEDRGRRASTPFGYYVLRGSSTGGDVNNAYRVFVEKHHYLEMSQLISKLKAMTYSEVKKRRDWYGDVYVGSSSGTSSSALRNDASGFSLVFLLGGG